MGFVPGRKHDLFLSYAHKEAAWANAFMKALCDEFQERTGQDLTFWQDNRKLRIGQKWTSEIEDGIRTAAAFLAVVSPIYLRDSPWCRQERAIALESGLDALKVESPVDSFYRFLKIIKTPGPGNAHEELLGELQDVRFFDSADNEPLPHGSAQYTAMIRELYRQLKDLLTLMSNQRQELYLAPGAIDMHTERAELDRELRDRGFIVKPDVLLDTGFGKGAIRDAMEKISHAIFLFGGKYERFTNVQIEIAADLKKPIFFWVQPGHKATVERIHGLGEILGGLSISELVKELEKKLKPAQIVQAPSVGAGTPRVYVNYDVSRDDESPLGAQIAALVRARQFEALQNSRDGEHDRLMQISNGVLVFRAANENPDWWLKYNAEELARPGQPFSCKGLLVADAARVPARAAGVPIYEYSRPFDPEKLDPFFECLKTASSGNAR